MDSDLGRILSDGKKIAFRNILLKSRQSPLPQHTHTHTHTYTFALPRLIVGERLIIYTYSFDESFPKIV